MGRADGPHTRNPLPASIFRGSKKRLRRLSATDDMPLDLWLFVAVALTMLAICAAIIYNAL
jgi:hypothetical protein